MSCDLQRIVPTFVPSFDPLLTDAPEPSDLISGATQLRRPTLLQLHCQNPTPAILPFLPKSGRVNELLPCSYAPPSVLHCGYFCAHPACMCGVFLRQSVLASLLRHRCVSRGVPSPSISRRLARQRPLSLQARPGRTFEWRDRWQGGWGGGQWEERGEEEGVEGEMEFLKEDAETSIEARWR